MAVDHQYSEEEAAAQKRIAELFSICHVTRAGHTWDLDDDKKCINCGKPYPYAYERD